MSILTANIKLYSPFQKQPLIFRVYLFLELSFLIVFLGATLSQNSMDEIVQRNQLPFYILIMAFMLIFFIGQMIAMVQLDLMISFNNSISCNSIPLILSAILLLIAVWKTLGDPDLKRKCFEKPSKLMTDRNVDFLDQIKTNNELLSNSISDTPDSGSPMAEIFIKAMNKSPFFSMYHSLMGIIYFSFSRYFIQKIREYFLIFILAAFILFLSGYLGSHNTGAYYGISISPFPLLAILPICMFISSIFASSNHKLFLPSGRSRQFRISILIWLIKYAAVVIFVSMVIAASWIVQGLMPELTLNGYWLTYSPPGLYIILWALIIMPVVDFLFGYVEVPFRLFTMVLLTSIVFILSIVSFTANNIAVHTALTAMMIIITNGLFIILLVRYWFKRDHA